MASERLSIAFQEAANPVTMPSENSSIAFEVKPSQPATINARANDDPLTGADTESIQFNVKDNQSGGAPNRVDKPSENSSIAFEVNQSQPATMRTNRTNEAPDIVSQSGEIQFKGENSQPIASATHESVDFEVLDEARAGGGAVVNADGDASAAAVHAEAAPTAETAAAGEQYAVSPYPPPRRLSRRAAVAASTPRGHGPPQTPRQRSPTSSHRPVHDGAAAAHGNEHEHEEEGEEEPAAAVNPHDATQPPQPSPEKALDDVFSEAGGDDDEEEVPSDVEDRAALPPPPGPSLAAATVVTSHTRHFEGEQWGDVVTHSHDTVERTITRETAQALGIDDQFLRVSNITADGAGMEAEISIAHDPVTLPEDQVTARIAACPYENTYMLHELRTARGAHQANGLGAALESREEQEIVQADAAPEQEQEQEEEQAHQQPPAHSFTTILGQGAMMLIEYSVPSTGASSHLELFVDGTVRQMKGQFIKQFVSEHVKVPAEELTVRYLGKDVADDATGTDMGWSNGCVINVIRTPGPAPAADVAAAREPLAAKKATKESPRKTKPPQKSSAARAAPAADKKEKKAAAAGQKRKKAKKAGERKSAKTPAAHKKAAKKAAAKKPTKASRGSRKSSAAPVPRRRSTTQSGTEPPVEDEHAIPDIITTPRRFIPRTPRPGGEQRPLDTAPLFVEEVLEEAPVEVAQTQTSRRSTTPHATRTPPHQRSGSSQRGGRPGRSPSQPAASEAITPPQCVARGVVPTTPRAAVRPVVNARSETVGGMGSTPSVSRRSHSPHRTPPMQSVAVHRYADNEAEAVAPAAAPAAPAAAYHPYMGLDQSAGYDVDYEMECMGEPARENAEERFVADVMGVADVDEVDPVPSAAPNPFI